MPGFVFSPKSRQELQGVKPELVAVVTRALDLSSVDFVVHDGLRTLAEQRELFKAGASQRMDSKHLTGEAVDLVPIVNGKWRWEWGPLYRIAEAVRAAARELGVSVVWGGAWDVVFTETHASPETLVSGYTERRRARHLPAFTDGPHFELHR